MFCFINVYSIQTQLEIINVEQCQTETMSNKDKAMVAPTVVADKIINYVKNIRLVCIIMYNTDNVIRFKSRKIFQITITILNMNNTIINHVFSIIAKDLMNLNDNIFSFMSSTSNLRLKH